MAVNVELLDRTLAHIEEHPESWFQRDYRCETGMCFAGWACELAGGQWADDADPDPDGYLSSFLVADETDEPRCVYEWNPQRPLVHAVDRARVLLGLDDQTATELFVGDNDIHDLRRIVADIKAGAQ